ncbi:hypothetical protein NE237_019023 [Protea cynaroides]|uniref:Uncharacterized protein n=1 Tax=Protea cynaroides TaxID=273540 RepID=A0A9Q0KB32_9MAGN|nr:hypothetical protein NE237_019023 [Protea cynaroides]
MSNVWCFHPSKGYNKLPKLSPSECKSFKSFKKDLGIGISYHELATYDFFLFNGHCLIGDHDVYPNSTEAKAKDFESLPLNIALNRCRSKSKIKSSKVVEVSKSDSSEDTGFVGKHKTPKFNFRSTFCGAKIEDKGKVVATPNSSKKWKIIPYMPSNKSITISELPIVITDGMELETHPLVNEPSSSNNREPDRVELFKTLSMTESIGSVASKKALFELRNFVVGKPPKFYFSDFIVDFNALTPPTPDEEDGIPALTNGGSNTKRWLLLKRTLTLEGPFATKEIHFSSTKSRKIARVAELRGNDPNFPLTMAILITNLEVLLAENDELRNRGGPSSSNNSLNLQLLDAQNKCNTLKEELRKLGVELNSQVEITKDLLSEHATLAIENVELQEVIKAQESARSPC